MQLGTHRIFMFYEMISLSYMLDNEVDSKALLLLS